MLGGIVLAGGLLSPATPLQASDPGCPLGIGEDGADRGAEKRRGRRFLCWPQRCPSPLAVLSSAPSTTNSRFVTSPSFLLSSAFSEASTLIPAACYFGMLFPSSPGCKYVKLGDPSLSSFPPLLFLKPAGCLPNSLPTLFSIYTSTG